MNHEDVKSAFGELKKMSPLFIKLFFKPMLNGSVKLMKQQGKTEIQEKLKLLLKDRIWKESGVCFDSGKISSKLMTVTHGDAWINNMMFNTDDPQVRFIYLLTY